MADPTIKLCDIDVSPRRTLSPRTERVEMASMLTSPDTCKSPLTINALSIETDSFTTNCSLIERVSLRAAGPMTEKAPVVTIEALTERLEPRYEDFVTEMTAPILTSRITDKSAPITHAFDADMDDPSDRRSWTDSGPFRTPKPLTDIFPPIQADWTRERSKISFMALRPETLNDPNSTEGPKTVNAF